VASTPWNICLFGLGVTAAAYWYSARQNPEPPRAPWLLLFPCYVVLQLLPLPLFLLRLLSPVRASDLDSLARLMPAVRLAALAVVPALTITHWLRIIAYVMTFGVVSGVTGQLRGHRRWIMAAPLTAVAAAEAIWGISQHWLSTDVQGTYANKNHFAGLLEMVLPMTAAHGLALWGRGLYLKAVGVWTMALLIVAGIVASLSKMGFVAGLAGLFVLGTLVVVARVPGKRKGLVIAGLAAVMLFCFVFLPSDQFVANYGSIAGHEEAALEGRAPIWRDTLHLIAAYPLFGCGLGNYETAFFRYQTSVVDRVFTYAHNDYLQAAAELGLMGVVIAAAMLLPMIGGIARGAWREADPNRRYLAQGCAGALAAMGLHSLTDFNMYVPANAMVLAWICGIGAAVSYGASKGRWKRRRKLLVRLALAMAVVLIVYAAARLVFDSQFSSNADAESRFCSFGICDTDAVMTAAALSHGGRVDRVPAAQVLQALARDPANPNRWCDTGARMVTLGRLADAGYGYSRAVTLGPHIPPILIQAADFDFAGGRLPAAFGRMRTILADTSEFDATVFAWYSQHNLPAAEILRQGLPAGPRAARSYLRELLADDDAARAKQVWNWIAARGLGDAQLAREYLDYLFRKHDYETAAYAWAEYLGPRRNGYLESNFVYNGGFEIPPTDSEFDWHVTERDGVEAAVDPRVAHAGSRALRIHFGGKENLDYNGVAQAVFVKPGRYRFEAWVRTQEITTDKGSGFHIYDREASGRIDVRTEQLTGTHDWTKIEQVISVPKESRLIEIEVARQPSQRFDNQIAGTVWIDDVTLGPL
jgi:O-antigen ligase